ncbi:flagellin [Cryobacterium sp. Y29]|uniref:flagellin N-terminal helical domain-containing protein n=1 Tax=Cryobacterium sp. Y29 TaxID=2048285 RepID=UPI000CE48477|nr:flagellin [Cryobacterium sp. Y29]
MGMQVNTNIAANNAYRNLATTQNDLSKSLEKLSSGLRINRAADDAAGLAISEGLKSQVGGLTVAARNAQDGISVIQTAEGSLNEVTSILQRMRDLAVQAGNDSNSIESRGAITTEVGALRDELSRISESTNFNGTSLLNGAPTTSGVLNFQIGANGDAGSQIQVGLTGANVQNVVDALDFGNTVVKDTSINATGISDIEAIQFAQGGTTVSVAAFAGPDSDLAAYLNNDASFKQNFTASSTSVTDASNVTTTTLKVTSNLVSDDPVVMSQLNGANPPVMTPLAATFTGTTILGFDSAASAQLSINAIDQQITDISTARADLGAVQNRFESVIKNLAVSKENLTAAGSRIRDTDMAEEMVKYTRANILSQAGTAMLAQANQSNSGVLQLLQ